MLNEQIVKLAHDIYIGLTYMPNREQIYQMAKWIIDKYQDRKAEADLLEAEKDLPFR